MSSSGLSLAERLNVSVPGGRVGRVRAGGVRRPSPYGSKPPSSSGKFGDREESQRDLDSPWTHDKFAKHNGIEGGELGARIAGNEIFSRCGAITEYRLLSPPSASSVRVFLHFETSQGAQTAVTQFDKQTADGRTLNVFTVSAGPLGSRLGVAGRKGPPKGNVDLLADTTSSGGMRSDELIARDPRAKVILDPSGINKLLEPASTKPSQGGPRRGGGRGRSGRGARGQGGPVRSLSDRMVLD
ncbi:hypothetical protein M408DRAFT_320674 [Serendipita vermifera MAFF 305830]|uniref:RRM domain-containing protein n=1 Tax=Serendipita vermifera MAFF 305830 TaxID=933852 RepID=A0A0C3B3V0_SERVB|nr:hypothetical protein M408DRAFT_320674 [Serendipita vermifera MAFF 305830]